MNQPPAKGTPRKAIPTGRYKARGVVLHSVKYGERKAIVYMLTREFGRRSFITTVNSGGRGVIQPLFILDFDGWAGRGELHSMERPALGVVLRNIPFDVVKSTISLFLSELLYRLIREEQADEQLYDFVERAVVSLDAMVNPAGAANFHLWFLVHLCRYMGYMPEDNHAAGSILDYRNGNYITTIPSHTLYMPADESALFHLFGGLGVDALGSVALGRSARVALLERITDMYGYHTDAIYHVNSLRILSEIF